MFESGAILLYLAEKTGRLWPQDLRAKYEVAQWVIWQMANQGPKFGERGHFRRLGDREGDLSYALRRFNDEVNRLYGVLNIAAPRPPLSGGRRLYIADMISYPWTADWKAQGQDIDEFKHFKRWFDELGARPAVQRGLAVGADLSTDPASSPRKTGRDPQDALQPARPAGAGLIERLLVGATRLAADINRH